MQVEGVYSREFLNVDMILMQISLCQINVTNFTITCLAFDSQCDILKVQKRKARNLRAECLASFGTRGSY